MRTLYGDIFTEVQGKIDEVYVYFQELLGITSGDQPIDLAITENGLVQCLAETIMKTLEAQKGESL